MLQRNITAYEIGASSHVDHNHFFSAAMQDLHSSVCNLFRNRIAEKVDQN
jgi:hypothetical protein